LLKDTAGLLANVDCCYWHNRCAIAIAEGWAQRRESHLFLQIMLKDLRRKAHTEQMFSANGRAVARGNVKSEVKHPCESEISELRGLAKFNVTRNYPRGATLLREGQRPHGVHVLCEGRAKVLITSEEGKTLLLRIAQPGELLGLNAVLTGRNYSTTVETIEPARVDFIARADLMVTRAR
jgi:CRP-like cAMP-binding protein